MKKVQPQKITQYKLEGMLMPLNPFSNNPVFLTLNGKYLLPIFSTKEKFDETAKWAKFEFAKCTVIIDVEDFINSILHHKIKFRFHVVVDPYVTPEGNTRFQLIPFDEEEKAHLGEDNG